VLQEPQAQIATLSDVECGIHAPGGYELVEDVNAGNAARNADNFALHEQQRADPVDPLFAIAIRSKVFQGKTILTCKGLLSTIFALSYYRWTPSPPSQGCSQFGGCRFGVARPRGDN
jgi:hypothetical protein